MIAYVFFLIEVPGFLAEVSCRVFLWNKSKQVGLYRILVWDPCSETQHVDGTNKNNLTRDASTRRAPHSSLRMGHPPGQHSCSGRSRARPPHASLRLGRHHPAFCTKPAFVVKNEWKQSRSNSWALSFCLIGAL